MFRKIAQKFGSKYTNRKEMLKETKLIQRAALVRQQKQDKKTKQIAESLLKKSGLVKDENVFGDNIVRVDRVKPQDVYKLMDTSVEGFFQRREMNQDNFNLLLLALSEKKDLQGAVETFEKMKMLGVEPNSRSYVNLIMVCSKCNDLELATELFDQAIEEFGPSNYIYNALLSAYARNASPVEMQAVFNDMKSQGIVPNQANYTTLIQGLNLHNETELIWNYYDNFLKKGEKPDEVLTTLMIKICAKTEDAEKGLKLFNEARQDGYKFTTCYPFNSLIRAFASRVDYAEKGIEVFDYMISSDVLPDSDSFKALFLATGKCGNVKKAFNGLQLMKEYGIKLETYHYMGLIRTYGSACLQEDVPEKMINQYVKDSWVLFQQADKQNMVDEKILDALLNANASGGKIELIEGSIMPLYEHFNIPMTSRTFKHLFQVYLRQHQYPKILRIYEKLESDLIHLDPEALNPLLEALTNIRDTPKIANVLQIFIDKDEKPSIANLERLGSAGNLPDTLRVLLNQFPFKGFVVRQHNWMVLQKHIEKDLRAKNDRDLLKFKKLIKKMTLEGRTKAGNIDRGKGGFFRRRGKFDKKDKLLRHKQKSDQETHGRTF